MSCPMCASSGRGVGSSSPRRATDKQVRPRGCLSLELLSCADSPMKTLLNSIITLIALLDRKPQHTQRSVHNAHETEQLQAQLQSLQTELEHVKAAAKEDRDLEKA